LNYEILIKKKNKPNKKTGGFGVFKGTNSFTREEGILDR